MTEGKYITIDTIDQAKCNTFNFTVPSVWPLWVLLVLAIIAIIINYFYTFIIWIFDKRP